MSRRTVSKIRSIERTEVDHRACLLTCFLCPPSRTQCEGPAAEVTQRSGTRLRNEQPPLVINFNRSPPKETQQQADGSPSRVCQAPWHCVCNSTKRQSSSSLLRPTNTPPGLLGSGWDGKPSRPWHTLVSTLPSKLIIFQLLRLYCSMLKSRSGLTALQSVFQGCLVSPDLVC